MQAYVSATASSESVAFCVEKHTHKETSWNRHLPLRRTSAQIWGLIAAVAQDAETLDVLMLAWMNPEAWEKTLETGEAHYYNRSRRVPVAPKAARRGMCRR